MTTVRVPKHIYWSCRETVSVNRDDPAERKWLLEQVLVHGTMADIRGLNVSEIEEALPRLHLPRHVRALWSDYFECRDSNDVS